MTVKPIFKTATPLLLLVSAMLTSGCGGDSQGSSTTLPDASTPAVGVSTPAPILAPGADTSTLAGTVISKNGIRSEVDNVITSAYGNDAVLVAASVKLAQYYQSWLTQPAPSQTVARDMVVEELRLSRCIKQLGTTDSKTAAKQVLFRTFNTVDRLNLRQGILKSAGAFLLPAGPAQGCF